MLGAHKGYTRTHQVIADVRQFGGGLEVAHRLAEANIITNKNLLPNDRRSDWDRPSGLRIGTTEVTRLGMGDGRDGAIADMIAGGAASRAATVKRRGDSTCAREPARPLRSPSSRP